ncbi:12186_t:CDS:2, partial [Gigaspora rosea]
DTKGTCEDDAMSVDDEPLDKKEGETNQSPPLKSTTEIPENCAQSNEKSAESVNKEKVEKTEEAPSKKRASDARDTEQFSGLKRRCEELERDLTAERRKVRVLALTAVGFATTTARFCCFSPSIDTIPFFSPPHNQSNCNCYYDVQVYSQNTKISLSSQMGDTVSTEKSQ